MATSLDKCWPEDGKPFVCSLCEEEIAVLCVGCGHNHRFHNACLIGFGTTVCPLCFNKVAILEDGTVDYKQSHMQEDEAATFHDLCKYFVGAEHRLKSCHPAKFPRDSSQFRRMCRFFIGKKILLLNAKHPIVLSLRDHVIGNKSLLVKMLPEFLYTASLFDMGVEPSDPIAASVTILKFMEAAVSESIFLGDETTRSRIHEHFLERISHRRDKFITENCNLGLLEEKVMEDMTNMKLDVENAFVAESLSPVAVLLLDKSNKKEIVVNKSSPVVQAMGSMDQAYKDKGIASQAPVLGLYAAMLSNGQTPTPLLEVANDLFEFAELALRECVFSDGLKEEWNLSFYSSLSP